MDKKAHAEYQKAWRKRRYHSDPAFRARQLQLGREQYQKHRSKVLARQKERYHSIPEVREAAIQKDRRKQSDLRLLKSLAPRKVKYKIAV